MMCRNLLCAAVGVALATTSAKAVVVRVFWSAVAPGPQSPVNSRTFDLFAETTPNTRIVTVDFGDTSIQMPPSGQNTGLRIRGGSFRQSGSVYTSNSVRPGSGRLLDDPALNWDTYAGLGNLVDDQIGLIRPPQVTPAGAVETLRGTWFDVPFDLIDPGVAPGFSDNRVLLARVTVDQTVQFLGGDTLAPSRVFLYWAEGSMEGGGVFEIPNAIASGGGPGACCTGAACAMVAQTSCSGTNTRFVGAGTTCNQFGANNRTPCCFADYNQNGAVTVQDAFDFLAGYFTGNAQADVNGGGVTVQDIFDYLALYFAGCS